MAVKVNLITMQNCGLCFRLKALLKQKNVEFNEYPMESEEGIRILKKTQMRDFPIMEDEVGNVYSGRNAVIHAKGD